MQLPNAPVAEKFPTIVAAIQRERLMRYAQPAAGEVEHAFAYYVWNGSISESFHIALHYAEIVTRNAFNQALIRRFGAEWYTHELLLKVLDERNKRELEDAVHKERQQHGEAMTAHHVVSALTFGFWDHLATKRFERLIWAKGAAAIFPCVPLDKARDDIHQRIESVRRWRNRIAHHRAIFDKGPMRKHQEALELIGWACSETKGWVSSASRFPVALALRPK